MNNIKYLSVFIVITVIVQNSFSQKYFVKSYTIENGLPTRMVNDACQDNSGIMWFATQNGISSYDGFSFTNYDTTNGLPYQSYRKIKCDEHGIVWGVPNGLSDTIVRLQNNVWIRIVPATIKRDIDITSLDVFYQESNPVICVGSTAGIDVYQDGRWNHLNISDDLNMNRVFSVTAEKGKFYILCKKGLFVAEHGKSGWSLREFFSLPGETIIAIRFDQYGLPGEKLWLLTFNTLSYLDHGKRIRYAGGFSLPNPHFTAGGFLNFDGRGNYFFGNNWGKYFIRKPGNNPAPLMINNGFSSDGASSVFIDREQNVWFTDSRGVDKIGNLLMMSYYKNHGLQENEVTAILELKDGGMVL